MLKKFERFIGRFRLQTVLTVSLVLFIALAIGITGFLSFQNSQYAINDLSSQLENEISDRIVEHLDNYLEIPHLINQLCLDSIRLGEIHLYDNDSLKQHFQELSYRYDSVKAICYGNELEGNYIIISSVGAPGIANGTDRFLGISLKETNFTFEEYRIDHEGQILEQTLSIPNYDPRTRPWYKAAVEGKGSVWTPIYMWLDGIVSVDAVVPVYSDQGTLVGVLDTALTMTGIGDFLQNLEISKNGQAFIIEKSGLLVASSIFREPYAKETDELVRLSALDCNDTVISSTTHYLIQHVAPHTDFSTRQQYDFDIAGVRQFVQVTPYRDRYGLDWLIVVVIPESDFMVKINASNQTTVLLIIFTIIGTIIICILLARWITKPILSLNKSAKALANGDWTNWVEFDRSDELGELSHSFKFMADQLKTAFLSLKSSEERYLSLFESSADAILLLDGLLLLHINRVGEEMFGISGREAIGKDVRVVLGRDGLSISEMIESSISAQDNGYTDNTISRICGGIEHFMNIRLTQVSAEGTIYNLVLIRDITDQRQAYILLAEQEALRESYAHIQIILHLFPDPTFVIDNDGHILFWNQALERMTGVVSEEMIGKGDYAYSEVLYGSKRPILIDVALHPEIPCEDLYPYLEHSEDVLNASFWKNVSGERKFFSVIAAPFYDKNGHINGAIESIRDITSHKRAEEALRIANKKLNLLSTITRHDIINKVMISKLNADLLLESDMNSEQKNFITTIKQSLTAIKHFIAFTGTYQELGLNVPIWQDVRDTFNRAALEIKTSDVVIHNEVFNISILADPLFEKVCYNLIENAIRHGVHLTRIDITAYETNEGLRISVEDDGLGVFDDTKEKIFERGYGNNTGLGLFLAREILLISEITLTERGQYGTSCRFDIDVPKGKYKRDNESK